jgi:lipopolysaccharide/colanic/teichoic acid biosynthesis glycosyltransferase
MRNNKKEKKSAGLIRGLAISVFLLSCFLLEPSFRDKLTFATTFLDNSRVSSYNLETSYPIYSEKVTPSQQNLPGHAPEPTTLMLFGAGLGGFVIRFARKSFRKFKRIMDLFLAVLGLFLISPVMLVAILFIKATSKGPVIYRQNRVGLGGKVFRIYKLRTMRVNAEKGTGAVWAKANDPRITPIGRILRKTHLDEIPQVLNVIKGEMSIVGPRPERPEMVRDFKKVIGDYEKRLHVQPGITGMAQIYHKYDETIADVRKKIKYDLLYIRKMCWLVEVRILAQTFVVALTGKGAR